MRSAFARGTVLAAAVAAVALVAPAAATAAKLDAQDVKDAEVVTAEYAIGLPGTPGTGGGYALCPAGTSVVTGGAYMYPAGQPPRPAAVPARLSSSTATGGLNGWYADAVGGSSAVTLRVIAKCVPDGKLAEASLSTDSAVIGFGEADTVRARCPGNERAFTGGSFWHEPGQGPTPGNAYIALGSSSTPTRSADGWYANGTTNSATSRQLTAYAWCLPGRKLEGYRRVEAERGVDPLAVKRAACPRSHPAVGPAGVFFHRPGRGIDEDDAIYLKPRAMGALEAARRFVAAGGNDDTEPARMGVRGFCLGR